MKKCACTTWHDSDMVPYQKSVSKIGLPYQKSEKTNVCALLKITLSGVVETCCLGWQFLNDGL